MNHCSSGSNWTVVGKTINNTIKQQWQEVLYWHKLSRSFKGRSKLVWLNWMDSGYYSVHSYQEILRIPNTRAFQFVECQIIQLFMYNELFTITRPPILITFLLRILIQVIVSIQSFWNLLLQALLYVALLIHQFFECQRSCIKIPYKDWINSYFISRLWAPLVSPFSTLWLGKV